MKFVRWTLAAAALVAVGSIVLSTMRSPGAHFLIDGAELWSVGVLAAAVAGVCWMVGRRVLPPYDVCAVTFAAVYAARLDCAANHLCAIQIARTEATNACKANVSIHLVLRDDWLEESPQMLYRCTDTGGLESAIGLGREGLTVFGDGSVDVSRGGMADLTQHFSPSGAVCRW